MMKTRGGCSMNSVVYFLIVQLIIMYWLGASSNAKPILGEDVVDDFEHHSIALIMNKKHKTMNDFFWCTGALISKKHIITAASCFEGVDAQDLLVSLSIDTADSPNRAVSKLIPYSKNALCSTRCCLPFTWFGSNAGRVKESADVGIMELAEAADGISSAISSDNTPGPSVIVTGWGGRSNREFFPKKPGRATMKILDKTICEILVTDFFANLHRIFTLPDNLFCAASIHDLSVTWGDRGGPVYKDLANSNGRHAIVGILINSNQLVEQKIDVPNSLSLMLHLEPFKEFITKTTNREAVFVPFEFCRESSRRMKLEGLPRIHSDHLDRHISALNEQ